MFILRIWKKLYTYLVKQELIKLGGKSTNNIDVWNFADETEEDQANKGLEEATSNV